MAILKAINNTSKAADGTKGAIDYVEEKAEVTLGLFCSNNGKEAIKDFKETKEFYGKENGRQYLHDVISFAPDEVSNEKGLEIAKNFAEKNYKGHEVYLALHSDQDHTHVHMIVNSVNFENGYKIQRSPQLLKEQKENLITQLKEEGLDIPQKTKEIGQIISYDKNKYQVLNDKKSDSDLGKLAFSYLECLGNSKSKDEFTQEMSKKGYSTEWVDNRKNIVFTVSDEILKGEKNKFRLSNVQKTFSLEELGKEKLLEKFSENSKEREHKFISEMKEEIEKQIKPKTVQKKQTKNLGFER